MHEFPTASLERFPFSDAEFSELAGLVSRRTGLLFSPEKRREFQMKLDKLPHSSVPENPADLIDAVRISDEVLQKVINVLTVGESYFFRNRPHFNALRNIVIPELIAAAEAAGRKTLNIWCAGCASGEEPYSIAILLRDRFPQIADWDVTITATDINTDFLARARAGIYRKWSFRGVEESVLADHFSLHSSGEYRLHDNIKRAVSFKVFNLSDIVDGARPISGNLDMLLCRNVLIYFPFQVADRIVSAFRDMLRPGGYLFLGHSEAFPSLGNFEAIHSSATYFYRRYLEEPASMRSLVAPATASIPGFAVRASIYPGEPAVKGRSMFPSPDSAAAVDEGMGAMLDRARGLADNGKAAEALALLGELAEGPMRLDHRVHFLFALIADHAGYALRAEESLKRAIFLEKDFVVGHYYLGIICQREGDMNGAKRHFKNVLRLLDEVSEDTVLDEADGLTAGRLKEIVHSLTVEMDL